MKCLLSLKSNVILYSSSNMSTPIKSYSERNHLYFFESDDKRDKGTITIWARSLKIAYMLCITQFRKHKYYGSPKALAV